MHAASPSSRQQPVILVSGGSRGLGEGIVRHLLATGYRVATCSRRSTPAVEQLLHNSEFGESFLFFEVDLVAQESLRQLVAGVYQRFGRLDGLVNNAAVAHDGVLALLDERSVAQMLDVNLKGGILLAKECIRYMLLTGSGSVVNVTSVVAQRGFPGLSVYAATKAGMEGFTRALARELGPRNIRVNAIAPGYLETEMSQGLTSAQRGQIVRRTPLGRLGTVDDVAPCVEFLLSAASRFVTGHVLTVDGGASV